MYRIYVIYRFFVKLIFQNFIPQQIFKIDLREFCNDEGWGEEMGEEDWLQLLHLTTLHPSIIRY